MRFDAAMRTFASIGLVSLLAACGGGGGGSSPEPVHEAALGTAILVNKGDSSVAEQTYTLDATSSSSYTLSIGEVEIAFPENAAFDIAIAYLRGYNNKYLVNFWDNEGTDKSYSCRSSGWTNAELQAIAIELADDTIRDLAICKKNAELDNAARRMKFSDLVLTSDDGGRGTVTLSAHFTWLAP